MTISELKIIFEKHSNATKKMEMENYMKNNFPFFGLQKPIRAELQKEFLVCRKNEKYVDWDLVFNLWKENEREFQLVALDYLISKKKFLKSSDFVSIEKLIITKSWWDSVDIIASHLVGQILNNNSQLKEDIYKWNSTNSIWLRRSSIICQLKFKEKTDNEFLSACIESNLNSDEFFINKAIGWALREYSKTNPFWVKNYLNIVNLSNLTIREASKYLNK